MNKLLIVGGTGVEYRNNTHYTKESYLDYFKELSRTFEVTWITSHYANQSDFSAIISGEVFKKLLFFQRDNVLKFVLKKNIAFLKNVFQSDLVLVYLPAGTYLFFSLLLLKMLGKKYVVYVGTDFTQHKITPNNKFKSSLWQKIFAKIIRMSDKAIVRGAYLKGLVNKQESKVLITAPMTFKPLDGLKLNSIEDRYNKKHIVYVGQMSLSKGIKVIIDAIDLLQDQQVKVSFIGGGKDFDYIKAYALEKSLDQFKFYGWLDSKKKLSNILNNSTVLACPSIEPEGVPRVIDEAIHHKLPVIASYVGGIDAEFQKEEIYKINPTTKNLHLALKEILYDFGIYTKYSHNLISRYNWLEENRDPAVQHRKFLLSKA